MRFSSSTSFLILNSLMTAALKREVFAQLIFFVRGESYVGC